MGYMQAVLLCGKKSAMAVILKKLKNTNQGLPFLRKLRDKLKILSFQATLQL